MSYSKEEIKEFLKENKLKFWRHWNLEFNKSNYLSSFNLDGQITQKTVDLFNERFPEIEFYLGRFEKETMFNTGANTSINYIFKHDVKEVEEKLKNILVNINKLSNSDMKKILDIKL